MTGGELVGGQVGIAAWAPTVAARRAALLSVSLLGAGVVLGRPDVTLLAVPLLVGTVISLWHKPSGQVRATASVPSLVDQGRPVSVTTVVEAPGADLVSVLLPLGARMPHGVSVALAPAPDGRAVTTVVVPAGWGRLTVARPDLRAVASDGLLAVGPVRAAGRSATVLPAVDATAPGALPPRPAGLVGGHRTRRPGDGSELLDVRAFAAGDRLRRIDWRVSARRGDLHVRRTATDADADVVLCLDSRVDITEDATTWSTPTPLPAGAHGDDGSTLGIAVRSAATLAAAHLRHGDRVALVDLVHPGLGVRSGSGRRQLLRIRLRLARTRATGAHATLAVRPSALPTGAVVLVLSPFLDEAAADLAVQVRRRGATVLALDVLPGPVLLDRARPWRQQAQQVLLAERSVRLRRLAAAGVDVLPADPATLPALLRRLARTRNRR